MGVNTRYLEKYNQAYKNNKTLIQAIYFSKESPYYYEEIWLPVLGIYVPEVIEGVYYISNYGRIYTKIKSPKYPNGSIMTHSINAHGYHQINLQSINHRKIGCKIARLVMLHFRFVQGCQYFEVDHLDGNKDNNTIWNLEWVTPQENIHRAILNGQRPLSCCKNNGILLTDEQAVELFNKSNYTDDYAKLSKEYGVSIEYIDGLNKGKIRPYIKGVYYNRLHI